MGRWLSVLHDVVEMHLTHSRKRPLAGGLPRLEMGDHRPAFLPVLTFGWAVQRWGCRSSNGKE